MALLTWKNLSVVFCCITGLLVTRSSRGEVGAVTPMEIKVTPIAIGDVPPPDSPFYDNTTDSGYYYPPPSGAVPCEVADDVPFSGTYYVTSFEFGYATTGTGDQEVIVNFYGALNPDDSPAGPPVQSLDLTGLPGSSDGSPAAFIVDIDLTGGDEFNWTNSVSADGTYQFNWVGFTFQQQGAGLLTATGGGSQDVFWTNKNLNSPYGGGSFFWNFGGTPQASFHLQVSGSAVASPGTP